MVELLPSEHEALGSSQHCTRTNKKCYTLNPHSRVGVRGQWGEADSAGSWLRLGQGPTGHA